MDFIYEVENNLSEDLCNEIIRRFEKDDRKYNSAIIDNFISTNLKLTGLDEWDDVDKILFEKLNEGLEKYVNHVNKHMNVLGIDIDISDIFDDDGYLIQRTCKNGYYHWHADQFLEPGFTTRVITCIWYLNTLKESDGGFTEFLCGKKVIPKMGSLLFFPSTWTNIHRGFPVKGDVTKYTCITWLDIKM
jgi:hypothetical protein